MSIKIKSKIQVFPLVIPSGTTAQIKPFNVVMLADYKRVKGFYIIRNSGSAYLEVGIKDGSGNAIVEPVNITHLTCANNIEIAKRFFTETPFEANGKTLALQVQNFATLSADESIDLVLLLDNETAE
jgi:hypothetical protein